MPLIVPLQPVASQQVDVLLNGQQTTLGVYSRLGVLYLDVSVNDALVIGGVACRNANPIVRDAYLGFVGDFVFYDTSGALADPVYAGLGGQFILVYLAPGEIPPPLQ